MASELGRGAQVRLDGDVRKYARGGTALRLIDNIREKLELEAGGTVAAGNNADGSAGDGTAAEDEVLVPGGLADAENFSFTPAGTGAVTRTAQAKLRDGAVSVLNFAANLAELTADAGPATQKAINHAADTGARAVYWPALPGGAKYYYPMTGASLVPPTDVDMEFFGDGLRASVLKYDEGTNSAQNGVGWHPLFVSLGTTGVLRPGRLTFRNMGFEGSFMDVGGRRTLGGPVLVINSVKAITIDNCRFYALGLMATQCEYIQQVRVTNSEFEQIAKDAVRFRSSPNCIVTGNYFAHIDDDPVALHMANYSALQVDGGIGEGHIVTNNLFVDTPRIAILGGRVVQVAWNIFRRPRFWAIDVEYDGAGEGVNQQFSINVSNNTINDAIYFDSLTGASPYPVIRVLPRDPRATTESSSVYPGDPVTATGAFVLPYAFRDNRGDVATDAFMSGSAVKICGNIVERTLPDVAAYSDWGFGLPIASMEQSSRTFRPVDPQITTSMMRPATIISCRFGTLGLDISGNILSHAINGIQSTQPVSANLTMGLICQNQFRDISGIGISLGASTDIRINLRITDNHFDIDPYHLHALRGSGGTWTSVGTGSEAVGIYFLHVVGTVIEQNTFRNCVKAIEDVGGGSGFSKQVVSRNVMLCQPAAVNFSTSNKGIGFVPQAGDRMLLQAVDSDPTSAAFGTLLNVCSTDASAMPTTGYYLAGHFVHNSTPTGGAPIYGWQRITTGSAHVINVDWLAVYTSGGVATGTRAVSNGNAGTASGAFATIGGGNASTVSSTNGTVAGGTSHAVSGDRSWVPGGSSATDRGHYGRGAWSAGSTGTAGETQSGEFSMRQRTTDTTATRITADAAAAGANNTMNLPIRGAYAGVVTVVAKASGATAAATWRVNVSAVCGNTAATLVVYEGAGAAIAPTASNGTGSAWLLDVAADTTNGGIAFTVTGAAATTIFTHLRASTSEVQTTA